MFQYMPTTAPEQRTMLSVDNSQSDMSSPLRGLRGQVTGRPVLKKRFSANLDDLNGPPSAIGSSSWKKRNEAQINAMSERIAQMEECLFKVLRGADKPRMMPEVGCRLLAPGGLVAVVERVASLPQTKSAVCLCLSVGRSVCWSICLLVCLSLSLFRADFLHRPERGLQRHIKLPKRPKLVYLNEFSPQELCDFLTALEGDLCEKARFQKHAPKLVAHEVDGAGVKGFSVLDAAVVGIPLGDREHFVRGLKILFRLYEQCCKHQHELKISVLSAQHLPKLDIIESIDAYVTLRLFHRVTGVTQEHSTTVVENDYNPTWKREFYIFKIRELEDPGELSVLLFDNDLLTHDDLCGEPSVAQGRVQLKDESILIHPTIHSCPRDC